MPRGYHLPLIGVIDERLAKVCAEWEVETSSASQASWRSSWHINHGLNRASKIAKSLRLDIVFTKTLSGLGEDFVILSYHAIFLLREEVVSGIFVWYFLDEARHGTRQMASRAISYPDTNLLGSNHALRLP